MSGDIQQQQPFSLSFQVDALHSSSVSFGRFEVESLSWERKSSFNHNRYLEEVEKYAKPGSVTEKKEYFEAHFRNRALLRQASSVSQAERDGKNSDNSSYSTTTCDGSPRDLTDVLETQQIVENGNVCHFDDSPKSFSNDEGFGVLEYEAGLAQNLHSESSFDTTNSVNDRDNTVKRSSLAGDFCGGEHEGKARAMHRLELKPDGTMDSTDQLVESVKRNDNVETRENESINAQLLMSNVPQSIGLKSHTDDQAQDVQEEQCISGSIASKVHTQTLKAAERTVSSKPGLRPDANISPTCEVNEGISRTKGFREKQTPLRARAQKQMPIEVAPSLRSSIRQLKESPQSLKPKSSPGNQSEKELRPKRAITPQPSTPERSESRMHRSAASTMRQMAFTRQEVSRSVTNSSFTSSGGAAKKRENQMADDSRQLSGKPDLKEKQKLHPTANAVPRLLNREKSKVVYSSRSSAKAPRKNFQSENRMTPKSNPCSALKVNQAISATRSTITRGTGAHKARDKVDTSSIRSGLTKANQQKEVARIKGVASERKQKAREDDQNADGKPVIMTKKDGMGRSGHGSLRNSIGHSSGAGHHSATIRTTTNVGSGRTDNAFLRKSIGH